MPNIAIFVDVQNIYYTTRQAYGRQFDYRAFWRKIQQRGTITHAYAYAIKRSDNDQQIKFQDALRHIGFDVKLKPYIQRSDGSAKGDWDVGITIDVMTISPDVDEVVLLSGDGDFDLLLSSIRNLHDTTSCVFGVPSLTANSLIENTDTFIPIEKADLL